MNEIESIQEFLINNWQRILLGIIGLIIMHCVFAQQPIFSPDIVTLSKLIVVMPIFVIFNPLTWTILFIVWCIKRM